jgi:hypothetical protein
LLARSCRYNRTREKLLPFSTENSANMKADIGFYRKKIAYPCAVL